MNGKDSILGRSIVFLNQNRDPVGCCDIVLSSDSDPFPKPAGCPLYTCSLRVDSHTVATPGTPMVCTVTTEAGNISGTISISQLTFGSGFDYLPNVYGSEIVATITHNYTKPLSYRVHQFPIPFPATPECGTFISISYVLSLTIRRTVYWRPVHS